MLHRCSRLSMLFLITAVALGATAVAAEADGSCTQSCSALPAQAATGERLAEPLSLAWERVRLEARVECGAAVQDREKAIAWWMTPQPQAEARPATVVGAMAKAADAMTGAMARAGADAGRLASGLSGLAGRLRTAAPSEYASLKAGDRVARRLKVAQDRAGDLAIAHGVRPSAAAQAPGSAHQVLPAWAPTLPRLVHVVQTLRSAMTARRPVEPPPAAQAPRSAETLSWMQLPSLERCLDITRLAAWSRSSLELAWAPLNRVSE